MDHIPLNLEWKISQDFYKTLPGWSISIGPHKFIRSQKGYETGVIYPISKLAVLKKSAEDSDKKKVKECLGENYVFAADEYDDCYEGSDPRKKYIDDIVWDEMVKNFYNTSPSFKLGTDFKNMIKLIIQCENDSAEYNFCIFSLKGRNGYDYSQEPINSEIDKSFVVRPIGYEGTLGLEMKEREKGQLLGLTSRVKMNDGGIKHINMIDFNCKKFNDVPKTLRNLNFGPGLIINSGNSYHYYGLELVDESKRLSNFEKMEGEESICQNWIKYQKERDYSMLRLTANHEKPHQPDFLCLYS